jgi:hypothetical protein
MHKVLKIPLGCLHTLGSPEGLNPAQERALTSAGDSDQKLFDGPPDLNHVAISQLSGHQCHRLLLERL